MDMPKTAHQKYLEEAALRRQEALRLHAEGKTVAEIAWAVGVTRQRVYQIVGHVSKGAAQQ